MTNDVEELVDVIEADDRHERAGQLGVIRGRRIARRFMKGEVEREQRRQQVVLKSLGPASNHTRHQRLIEQLEEGLVRVERRRHQLPRPNHLAVAGLDPDRPTVLDNDARRFGQKADVAATLAYGRFQRAGERRAAAARHLRLRRARDQRGDVMAEAALAKVHLAQAVEEQQAGHHRGILELPLHELERRHRAHLEQPPARG